MGRASLTPDVMSIIPLKGVRESTQEMCGNLTATKRLEMFTMRKQIDT